MNQWEIFLTHTASLFNPLQIHVMKAYLLLQIFYVFWQQHQAASHSKQTRLIKYVIHISNTPNRCINTVWGCVCVYKSLYSTNKEGELMPNSIQKQSDSSSFSFLEANYSTSLVRELQCNKDNVGCNSLFTFFLVSRYFFEDWRSLCRLRAKSIIVVFQVMRS